MQRRDELAMRFAIAIVRPGDESGATARRAYDLADAMLAEGALRDDGDEARAIADETGIGTMEAFWRPSNESDVPQLLEAAPPWDEEISAFDEDSEARFLELTYDAWDAEPRWSESASESPLPEAHEGDAGDPVSARPLRRDAQPPAGPGLARTAPSVPAEPGGKIRSA